MGKVTKLGLVPGVRRGEGVKAIGHQQDTAFGAPHASPAQGLAPGATSGDQKPGDVVQKDHFIERNGIKFAGVHLLVELWGASNLGDLDLTDRALRECGSGVERKRSRNGGRGTDQSWLFP